MSKQTESFFNVVGEMWHELQKFEGEYRRVALELSELSPNCIVVRASIGYHLNDEAHYIISRAFPFSDLPPFIETTMMFRELEDAQRRKIASAEGT